MTGDCSCVFNDFLFFFIVVPGLFYHPPRQYWNPGLTRLPSMHAKINYTTHTRHRIRLQEPADARFGKSFAAAAIDRPSM